MRKKAFFMDFEFDTGGVTLFPRPETEILVEKAILFLPKGLPCNILDIGTGSGNIAISLTRYLPFCRIVASDITESALRIARENAKRYEVRDRMEFIKSNLFENIRNQYRNFFDLVISNPPYVSLRDLPMLPAEVKEDPYVSLYGGADGLDFYRKIVKEAPHYLKKDGILLMEMGYGQAARVKELLDDAGAFHETEIYRDYSGIERIIKARKDG